MISMPQKRDVKSRTAYRAVFPNMVRMKGRALLACKRYLLAFRNYAAVWRVIHSGLWLLRQLQGKLVGKHLSPVVWADERRDLYERWGPVACSARETNRLRGLRDKYIGNRLFVLGNGPSLNEMNLDRLATEYTFATNRIYLLFPRIQWRPTFYTTLDWRVTPDNLSEINALRGMTLFFPQRFNGLLRTGPDVYWFWSRYQFHNSGPIEERRFSFDATQGVCPGGTVTVAAIQLAVYLGFDPIYLVGCDTSYSIPKTVVQSGPDQFGDGIKLHLESTENDDSNHFDPTYFGKGRKWHNPNVKGMIDGYINCKRAMDHRSKKIYNATLGGNLEVFPRVNYDSLF